MRQVTLSWKENKGLGNLLAESRRSCQTWRGFSKNKQHGSCNEFTCEPSNGFAIGSSVDRRASPSYLSRRRGIGCLCHPDFGKNGHPFSNRTIPLDSIGNDSRLLEANQQIPTQKTWTEEWPSGQQTAFASQD